MLRSTVSRLSASVRRAGHWGDRFRKGRSGSTAIEFTMVAPLFFGALFAILETGTLYLRATAIEAGVEEAKRVTMTGQVSASGNATAQLSAFRAAFCKQVDWLIDCNAVKFDVRAFTTFSAAAMPNPVVGGVFNAGALTFQPGTPCQIVVIRAYYETATFTGFIRNDVAALANKNILLGGAAAFKNEPFGPC